MSPPSRPKGEFRSAQHEGTPVCPAGPPEAARTAVRSTKDPNSCRVDATSGEITTAKLAHPEVHDLFDDLGELVLTKSGEFIIVPARRMPTNTGATAIYRF